MTTEIHAFGEYRIFAVNWKEFEKLGSLEMLTEATKGVLKQHKPSIWKKGKIEFGG